MSKFLDRLDKINRGTPASLGFGVPVRAEKVPSMALLATLTEPAKSAEAASVLARIGADGVLIEGMSIEDVLEGLAQSLDNVPWGLRVHELKGEDVNSYREKGCDFLAFGPENALLGALEDENTGYLLCIPPDMDERYLRAIEDLPVDAALLVMKSVEPPITLQHLITISSVRGAFSKYLLLEIPGTLTTGELEGLRDIGVDGLVVDATALSAEELERLKHRLFTLPRRLRARPSKPRAILPSTTYTPADAPSHEEDEEEE